MEEPPESVLILGLSGSIPGSLRGPSLGNRIWAQAPGLIRSSPELKETGENKWKRVNMVGWNEAPGLKAEFKS